MTINTPSNYKIHAAEMPTEPLKPTLSEDKIVDCAAPTTVLEFTEEDRDAFVQAAPQIVTVDVPSNFAVLERLGPWLVILATMLVTVLMVLADDKVSPIIRIIGSWATQFEIVGAGPLWYVLLSGLVLCWPLLRRTQGLGLLEKWLLRAAAGSVFMSLVLFLAGCSGYPLAEQLASAGILWPSVFGIVFAVEWRRRVKRVTPIVRETWTLWQMILSLLLMQAVMLTFASVPAPPLLYDVTEYHLGALSDYGPSALDRAPVYGPVQHNMYARFPFPIETLYHASLTPKMLNALAVIGCALLVYIWLERAAIRRVWRLLAAFIVMGHAIMLEVNTDAMIDAPVAFLVLASVYALMLAGGMVDGINRPKMIPVAALILSGALCTKYTVGQIYLLPIVIFALIPLTRMVREERHWNWWFIGLAVAMIPPMIWVGKNVMWYGNPTEPFFHWLFCPSDKLAIAREQYYIESHFPQSFISASYWLSLPKRISVIGWPILASLVVYCIPSNLFARRDGWRLAMIVIVSLFLWNLVGEAQGRFLLPSVLMAVVAGIMALHNTWHIVHRHADFMFVRAAMVGLAVMMGCSATALTAGQWYRLARYDWLTYAFEMGMSDQSLTKSDGEFYKTNLGALGTVLSECATTGTFGRRSDNSLLMVYEARPWLWHHVMPKRWAHITYNTVFDHSELLRLAEGAMTPEQITERLNRAGITFVLVNNEELRRFAQQYARPRELAAKGLNSAVEIPDKWHMVDVPEDFYAPFSRDPQWGTMRPIVVQWLKQMRRKAVVVAGRPDMEIWLAPVE